ncbi:MAG: hypothetical protein AB1644_01470 [Candidatus Zixiibacteriota bacterium]
MARNRRSRSAHSILAAFIVIVITAQAGQTGTAIRIGNVIDVPLGSSLELPISLDSIAPGVQIAGFDLLIKFDGYNMRVDSVIMGPLLAGCAWEYFTYRLGIDDYCPFPPCPESPVSLLRIVALAETNNGDIHPSCMANTPGELARLRVSTSSHPDRLCNLMPVRFYWKDCGDNMVALATTSDTLLLSDRVYEFGIRIDDPLQPFPSYQGAPSRCVGQFGTVEHVRGIDYYNGYFQFVCQNTTTDYVTVALGQTRNAARGQQVSLPIDFHRGLSSMETGGFDMLVTYDPTGLVFQSATPGPLLLNCGWEYFTYTVGADSNCTGAPCPIPLVRIVALAEINNGDLHPSCWLDSTGTLARLLFMVRQDSSVICGKFPVAFLWNDCGDNLFSSRAGDSVFFSRYVLDENGFSITQDTTLPTRFGAPSSCIAGSSVAPTRFVDYVNGYVAVECHPQIDYRGDLNLNGLAYEIADWVLFSEYFQIGDSAFTINPPLQRATSDVTLDGLELTMLDYIYMYRILTGLAVPWNDTTYFIGDSMYVDQDVNSRTVTITGPDSLAGLYLKFRGNVVPYFPMDSTDLVRSSFFDGLFTRILIGPQMSGMDTTPLFATGVVLTYNGSGVLEEVSGADYTNTYYSPFLTANSDPRNASVQIGRVNGVALGSQISIPVTLGGTWPNFEFSGFDLLLEYDGTIAALTGVTAGQLLTDCQWEYFTYRVGPGIVCDSVSCPSQSVRLVSVADINNGGIHPTCYADTMGVLANLSFQIDTSSAFACFHVPVRFAWADCGDNVFALKDTDTLVASRKVYDLSMGWPTEITGDVPLPSVHGTPSSCIAGSVLRGIDYYSGGFDIRCNDSIDARGDINLNGLAYEIADWVTFVNYFLLGPEAFTVNRHSQIAATDVNADGWALTAADLEYLLRVMVGDALPYPKLSVDSGSIATIVQDTLNYTVSLDYADSLGALYLVFLGEIDPIDTLVGGLSIGSVADSGVTRVLVSPWIGGSPDAQLSHVGAGLLFNYSGAGQLVFVDATYDGTQVTPTDIRGSDGICCRHRGNVEGWFDPSGVVDIGDLTELIGFLFGQSRMIIPYCWAEANCDGLGQVDIADISALVDFLFFGQALPPCQ